MRGVDALAVVLHRMIGPFRLEFTDEEQVFGIEAKETEQHQCPKEASREISE